MASTENFRSALIARTETADRLMRCKGYLSRATETLQNLMDAGIEPKSGRFNPNQYHQAYDHVETFSELGIRNFQFTSYAEVTTVMMIICSSLMK